MVSIKDEGQSHLEVNTDKGFSQKSQSNSNSKSVKWLRKYAGFIGKDLKDAAFRTQKFLTFLLSSSNLCAFFQCFERRVKTQKQIRMFCTKNIVNKCTYSVNYLVHLLQVQKLSFHIWGI